MFDVFLYSNCLEMFSKVLFLKEKGRNACLVQAVVLVVDMYLWLKSGVNSGDDEQESPFLAARQRVEEEVDTGASSPLGSALLRRKRLNMRAAEVDVEGRPVATPSPPLVSGIVSAERVFASSPMGDALLARKRGGHIEASRARCAFVCSSQEEQEGMKRDNEGGESHEKRRHLGSVELLHAQLSRVLSSPEETRGLEVSSPQGESLLQRKAMFQASGVAEDEANSESASPAVESCVFPLQLSDEMSEESDTSVILDPICLELRTEEDQ